MKAARTFLWSFNLRRNRKSRNEINCLEAEFRQRKNINEGCERKVLLLVSRQWQMPERRTKKINCDKNQSHLRKWEKIMRAKGKCDHKLLSWDTKCFDSSWSGVLFQSIAHERIHPIVAFWRRWRSRIAARWSGARTAHWCCEGAWPHTDDLLRLRIASQRFVIAQVNVVQMTNLPALTTEVATRK